MKALVTGGGGFLGRYIVEQLVARGDSVRTFNRGDYPELRPLGVETLRGDLQDREATIAACQGVDVVFHVAAVAGIWGKWDHFYGINVVGTRHVLEGCREHGVGRLVFTSSPSATFAGAQEGVDESAPYPARWLCHYSCTKAMSEQDVLGAHGLGGLATCALRPHLIWGPRDNQLVPRMLARARAGKLRRVGSGKNLIDITYVENAADAHLLAADQLSLDGPIGGQAFFISQGEPVNCWQWINELLELAGLPPVNRSISARSAWHAGAACEAAYKLLRVEREPPMTRFLAAQLAEPHYFDIARARQLLGYEPRVTTAEGMQRVTADLRTWAGRR